MSGFLRYLQPLDAWDWLVYVIMLLTLITLVLQGQKGNLTLTVMLFAVILGGVIDKVNNASYAFNTTHFYSKSDFAAYLVHIVMFVSPTVVAGMTKAPKSRGWAIATAVLAGVYLFGFWFVNQRV